MRSLRSIPFLIALAFAAFGAGATAQFAKRAPARTGRQRFASRTAGAAVPFRAGEKFFYQIGWMSLSEAATAELKVLPRRDFYGDEAWHFQAVAQTEDPLRLVMVVDDQFDSYCNAATLATRQYEMYLNEQGKRSVRKLALDDGSPGAERVIAPAGTLDPLAALYRLRSVDWERTPQFISPLYDGRHFYQMVARLVSAHDAVTVPAGRFDASRIQISVSPREAGGKAMQFTLWLANDPARIPVEVDAEISVGTIQGELLRTQ
jgi:Protein of unknown function (DUF3108)